MRVKTFKANTIESLEEQINNWLTSNSYKVARISHSGTEGDYTAIMLYQVHQVY